MDLLPGAILLPEPEVVEDDPVGRQVVGQGLPGAAVMGLVEDGVDDLAPLVARGPAASLRRRDEVTEAPPLGVVQVGGVGRPCHDPESNRADRKPQDRFLDAL